jgi:octaprenyl-diphosphate synthase
MSFFSKSLATAPQEDPPVSQWTALDETARILKKDLDQVEVEIKKRLISQVPSVTQIAQHIVMSGGKRIRPILLLLAAKALNYHGPRGAYYGAAIEFIHTATLLHDDVIDKAELRRGRPSCNSIWDNKMSVLVGDFLYCQVSSMIAEDGDLRVLKCVTDATANTTEGEVFEVIKSRDLELSESEYYKIIEFKTGMLMSCATEVGAILANADPAVQVRLRDFGMNLGIAFQLADDVLDYTSVEEEFGKAKGVDLKEGKITLPLLHALERCDSQEKEIIREGTLSANRDTFLKVLGVLKKYDSLDYTMKLAEARVRRAQELLKELPPSPYKEGLLKITDFVTLRRK